MKKSKIVEATELVATKEGKKMLNDLLESLEIKSREVNMKDYLQVKNGLVSMDSEDATIVAILTVLMKKQIVIDPDGSIPNIAKALYFQCKNALKQQKS